VDLVAAVEQQLGEVGPVLAGDTRDECSALAHAKRAREASKGPRPAEGYAPAIDAAVVIPNWNGRRWLSGCLEAIGRQTRAPAEVVVVDNGSHDGSLELLAECHPEVRVITLERNFGFAVAANRGIEAVGAEAVALVNTDVVLAPDWLARTVAALEAGPLTASVASKMVDLEDPGVLYDTGDILRRDGACEQRGRFHRDVGRFDAPGEVWGACAGAALYRRAAVRAVGGFDERFFSYLEDVDLGLRLRLAGWSCRYEPVVARHAGGGSSGQLADPVSGWVERNTLLLVAKAFPVRWAHLVAYRQLAWLAHAAREGVLGAHLKGALAALPLLPAMLRERRALRRAAIVTIVEAVPPQPIRGPRAGGHPDAAE
jgi:GT2 family glycosyltransferase